MKLTVDRERFLAAWTMAGSVAPSRSPKAILQNVRLEATADGVTLLATDLEISIRVIVQKAEVSRPGAVILPIDRVGPILRESSDAQLQIEAGPQGATIRGERSEFNLPAEDPEEFPAVPAASETKYHKLPARLFSQLITRTVFATDNESIRYALGGVLLEMEGDKITAVGTDGRRLARMEAQAEAVGGHDTRDKTTIVPTKAMQTIARALTDGDAEVQISARGNDVLIVTPTAQISARLVEGRFPRWRDVFPKGAGAKRIEMVVGPTHSAVRQAAIVTSEESQGVDFRFAAGKLVLTGRTAGKGQAMVELPIPYDGDEVIVSLNPRFVADFLRVLDPQGNFSVEIADSDSPALCSTDDGYAYVVMPLARG